MEELDIIARVPGFVLTVVAFALLANWAANPRIAGIRSFAFALSFAAIGTFLQWVDVSSRPALQNFFANFFSLGAYHLLWVGCLGFFYRPRYLVSVLGTIFTTAVATCLATIDVLVLDRVLHSAFLQGFIALWVIFLIRSLTRARAEAQLFNRGAMRVANYGGMLAIWGCVLHALSAIIRTGLVASGNSDVALAFEHVLPWIVENTWFFLLFAFAVILMTMERLRAELQVNEVIDPVTGTYNRRPFGVIARPLLSYARRRGDPVSVLVANIENLSSIRRRFGRKGEELVSRAFASIVMRGRRAQDICGNLQPGAYVLLLNDTDRAGACTVGRAIMSGIEQGSLPLELRDMGIYIKASFGVACAKGDRLDLDSLLAEADKDRASPIAAPGSALSAAE